LPDEYFSDRERGPRPRTTPGVTPAAWGGVVALIQSRIANGAFGVDYPEECPDGRGTTGTDARALGLAVRGEMPDLDWPLEVEPCPPTLAILDLLEFCHEHVAETVPTSFHSFFGHQHLSFDRTQGQADFRAAINRIFARNQLAYELKDDGQIRRLAAPVLHELLTAQAFRTGDATLDALLESARTKFLSPDANVRREAIEKLWDAWERVKTLEPGPDKRSSVKALLDKSADEAAFRDVLEEEARALTEIGNRFQIRHSETNQVRLQRNDHVDYLFHRLFALIWLVLRAR
jgi:hypothetical protein